MTQLPAVMNSLTASADGAPVAPKSLCRQWAPVFLLVVLGVCVAGRALGEAPSNQDCLGCHEDHALTKTVDGKTVSLAVKPDALDKSVHKGLSCTDCHATVKEVPHPEKLPRAQCASCHDPIAQEYAKSIHGM